MTSLSHAVGFLQNAYTIVLALALSEAFKQFVADSGDRNIHWNRSWSLIGFLFLIFPFFHGMSRYLYSSYLAKSETIQNAATYLMADGIAFMSMSAFFFIMSRSFSPDRWKRYYGALALLLVIDSVWIGFAYRRGVEVGTWFVLNVILGCVLAATFFFWRSQEETQWPPAICALTICATTIFSYFYMRDFYFS